MKFFEDTFEILNKPFNLFLLLLSEGFKEYNNNKYSVNSDKFEPNDIQTRFLKIVEDLKNIVLNQNTYNLKQLKTILNKKVDEYFKLIDLRIILKNLLLKLYKIRDLNFKNDEIEFNKNPLKFYNDIYKDINNDEVLKLSNKIIKPIYNIIKDIIIKDDNKNDNKNEKIELTEEDKIEKIKILDLDKDIYTEKELNDLYYDIFKPEYSSYYSKSDLELIKQLEKLIKDYKSLLDGYNQQQTYINKKFYKDKLDKIKKEILDKISKLKYIDEYNKILLHLIRNKSTINKLYNDLKEKRNNPNYDLWAKDYQTYLNLFNKLPIDYRKRIKRKGILLDNELLNYYKIDVKIQTNELYNRILFYLNLVYYIDAYKNFKGVNKGLYTKAINDKFKAFGIPITLKIFETLNQKQKFNLIFKDYLNLGEDYLYNLIDRVNEQYQKTSKITESYNELLSLIKEQELPEQEPPEQPQQEQEQKPPEQSEQSEQPQQPQQPQQDQKPPKQQNPSVLDDDDNEEGSEGLFKTKSNIDKNNININRIILKKQREKELKTIRLLKRQNKINQIISNFMKQQQKDFNEDNKDNKDNKEGGALFDKNLLKPYINRIS